MTSRYAALIVIAKEPLAGRVKTRIAATIGDEHASGLAKACLADTFHTAAQVGARHIVAIDGTVTDWIPTGWQCVAQGDGELDRRLATAFSAVAQYGPAFLIGMDTPQVQAMHLNAFDPRRYDACLGPATDGGYWGIGLADPVRGAEVIHDVPMSTESTFEVQLERMRSAGMRVQVLSAMTDVDTFTDALSVAGQFPMTHFGRAVAFLRDNCLPAANSGQDI